MGNYNNEWITLGEVVPYLSRVLGIERTRQTVHNWAVTGIKLSETVQLYLKTRKRAGIRYTQRDWVRAFIDKVDSE